MKGVWVGGEVKLTHSPPPEKANLKKPSLIRVKMCRFLLFFVLCSINDITFICDNVSKTINVSFFDHVLRTYNLLISHNAFFF